jgi:CubicO group peptidase (beta-lactamase class C family)
VGGLLGATAVAALPTGAAAAASSARRPPTRAEIKAFADELVQRSYPADGPGAAVLVARGDEVLYRTARGYADVGARRPLKPGSVFRIGSVTKQFAAAGLLKLVDAGKVGLNDPLSRYLPGFPNGDAITVRQILNHTSGVFSYTAIEGYMESRIREDATTAQMIATFKDLPQDFAPGQGWNYSNSGYVLVGAVIEAASGEPWHAWLERALFKPLSLMYTGYGADPHFAAMQVNGYTLADGKPGPAMVLSMTQPHAAGALVSNVDDLLRWNRALHEGRVLSPASYREMTTPTGAAIARGYGFGIETGKVRSADVLRHNGGIFGFVSSLSYLPGPDITVVVLENDDADSEADALVAKLAAFTLGEPYPMPVAIAVSAADLSAAEAVYRFDAETTRVLRVIDGKLTAQRGASPPSILTPIGKDDFLYADGLNRAQLVRGSSGEITGMRFFPSGDGDGLVGARTNEPLPAAAVGLALPRAALDRLVGAYAGSGLTMQVFMDGAGLKAQLAGQPPVTLSATTPLRFDVKEVDAVVEFDAGDGPASQLTIRQGGREIVLKRTP